MKLSKEDKAVSERGNYFSYGVHLVTIGLIEHSPATDEKPYIAVTVLGDHGEEDTVRCYFVGGASNISFNTLRQIYVHNAPEDKKDDARNTIDGAADTEHLVELLSDKLMDKECWYTAYPSPTRTYLDRNNVERHSIDKNIYGYEPKLKTDLIPDGQQQLKAEDFPLDSVPASAAETANIPKKW